VTVDELVLERRGSTLLARLNRPATRNALNRSLIDALGAALSEADDDPAIRAVVITGTGEQAFCAGMDLREFAGGADEVPERTGLDGYRRFTEGQISVPVVAAANATAVGGGFELLLSCDLIVASSQAMFGLPEVKRGLFPVGNSTLLATRIPLAVALELTLTGESISAQRAYELGLVNLVVPPEQVLTAALDLAKRIAANGPLALAAAKELVRLGATDPVRTKERLSEVQQRVFTSKDAREGASAFIEKRSPVWEGR
jgi:enoyl-CoA hydratase